MPDEIKPDPRFMMIAEEMTTEVKPNVIEAPSASVELLFDGASVKCPRCGLGALEPLSGRAVACLACPSPAPAYQLPWSVPSLSVNRYRCCKCGRQAQVTMEISDVNLHCLACKVLTLHAKQVEVQGTRPNADESLDGVVRRWPFSTSSLSRVGP